MNGVFRVFLSLSFSGSLLILLLLLARPLVQKRFSRRWQYYIWLVVIARLLLPLSPEVSLTGTLFQLLRRRSFPCQTRAQSSRRCLLPPGRCSSLRRTRAGRLAKYCGRISGRCGCPQRRCC